MNTESHCKYVTAHLHIYLKYKPRTEMEKDMVFNVFCTC